MRHCPYAVFNGCESDIEPEECLMCPLPHQEPADEVDFEDDVYYQPLCGWCNTPLAYEGSTARDAYCSDKCYRAGEAAADEAADNRYL